MTRLLMTAVLLATAATAQAQTAGGPPIAYVKIEGSGASIYLTNDGGSAPVKLASTAAKRTICALDLKPGGGELAYIECGKGVPRTLKVLNFSDAGIATGAARIIGGLCSVDTVDYHPTQSLLIVSEICNGAARVARIQTDGNGYVVLVSGAPYLNKARWLRDGSSFVYVRAPVDGGSLQICRYGVGCDLHTVNGLWSLDVGRQSNLILFDDGNGFIHQLDADTGAVETNIISGSDGHFSPDDGDVLFETPHSARGDYLHIRRANGAVFRLTGKGDYGAKDWRN